MSAKEVKEALVSVLTEKDIRKVKLGVTSKKIFSANYLFVKVLETTHTLEDFTPSGDTFCTEDFEIIHGVDHNMSDKAFNIPQKGSKVIIFTDQKKGPEGTVYIKEHLVLPRKACSCCKRVQCTILRRVRCW